MQVRNYKKLNEEYIKRDIECEPFCVATIFDDPGDSLWMWNKLLQQTAEKHAPLKMVIEEKKDGERAKYLSHDKTTSSCLYFFLLKKKGSKRPLNDTHTVSVALV